MTRRPDYAVERITAADAGLESLGKLEFFSSWAPGKYGLAKARGAGTIREATHAIPVVTLFTRLHGVLFWEQPSYMPLRVPPDNSMDRFHYMLGGLSVIPVLPSPDLYLEPLQSAVKNVEYARLMTLGRLAGQYSERSTQAERVTALATHSASILFHYIPPESGSDELRTLHDYMMDRWEELQAYTQLAAELDQNTA